MALALLQRLPWPSAPDLMRTVVADAGFADQHLLRWCAADDSVALVRGRIDTQVHDLYVPQPRRGRPRVWGAVLSLAEFAAQEPNFTQTIALYHNRTAVQLAALVGRHRVSGRPMRFVILRTAGKPDAVVMSTDLSLTPREIAGLYADCFAIELTFRDLKQHFGLGDYQVRLPEAMLRHVHPSGVACALAQLLTLRPRRPRWTAVKPTPWRRIQAVSVRESNRNCERPVRTGHLPGKSRCPRHLAKGHERRPEHA